MVVPCLGTSRAAPSRSCTATSSAMPRTGSWRGRVGEAVRRWRLSPAKLFSLDRERAETFIRGRVVMEGWKVWGDWRQLAAPASGQELAAGARKRSWRQSRARQHCGRHDQRRLRLPNLQEA